MAWNKKSISVKEYQKRAEQLVQKIHQEVAPFDDVSTAAKAARRKRAETDLEFFCKTYLPHHFDGPFESGHREIVESLKVWNKVLQHRGFRGLGKSTVDGVGYAAQAVLYKLTRYLPFISDTDDQAEMLMLPLKMELEENPRIKADFGEQKGVEWSEDSFVTSGGVKVEASSWRSFKRGRKYMQHRAKIIICDDLESLESVRNKKNIDKREDALLGDILNALDLKAEWQLIVVTNKLGRDDIDNRLLQNKAVLTVSISAEQKNGRAYHPKSFPKKVLNQIRDTIGSVKYNREYLLTIISSEQDDFQEDWFVRIDKPEPTYKFTVMVNDPSVGSTEGHDTKAILVMGLTLDEKHIDVMHADIRRTTISRMIAKSFIIDGTWNPHVYAIEANGFQTLIKPLMESYARDSGAGFGLISKIRQVLNKDNKNVRILRNQSGIENGFYRFVKGSDMDRLINQYLEFDSSITTNEDDGPDAMEMGVRELRRLNGEIGTVTVDYY